VTPYAVYHGYVDGELGRKVHVDRLLWSTEGPRLGSGSAAGVPTEAPQPLPDGPAYDPAVPFWHAELWVEGERLRLGELVVPLPAGREVLVTVAQRTDRADVLVDGRRVADGVRTGDPRSVARRLLRRTAVDGSIASLALTTWREDEEVRLLGAGEVLEVGWGGSLPVEVCVAVHGRAEVLLTGPDGTVVAVDVPAGTELPELVRLRTAGPVDAVRIVAGPHGAVVSDLVVVARPHRPARTAHPPAALTGEIPLPRRGAEA
jgi:hypothetical protein